MTKVKFGFCVPIFASPGTRFFRTPSYSELDAAATMQLALQAEELGYDSLWVADHLMLGKGEAIFEGWTVISALAGITQRAKLGMIHQGHFFRHPGIAANMSATLDQISGGRLIHFYDTGTQKREHDAYGITYPADEVERISAMVEGLELMIELWTSSGPVDFHGAHYHVSAAVAAPRPVQQPHPPIWLGEAYAEVLRATAKYAQGWNTTPVSIGELRRRLGLLRDACNEVGRPFDELEKSVELQVLIAQDQGGLRAQVGHMLALAGDASEHGTDARAYANGETDEIPEPLRGTTLIGSPSEISEQVQLYIDEGIDHFMLWFLDVPSTDGMNLFAAHVLPEFR